MKIVNVGVVYLFRLVVQSQKPNSYEKIGAIQGVIPVFVSIIIHSQFR